MITAKDINTRRFEQAKPGYKPEEVDEFLKEIADQINAMLKDKEDTEKKIEVLVESIRRYKADEEALKDAMIGAQKQGRAVIEEAKAEAEAIRDSIKAEMMERDTEEMTAGKYIVRWTSVLSNRFDTTAFKKAHGELYKEYTKQSASRRFSISA